MGRKLIGASGAGPVWKPEKGTREKHRGEYLVHASRCCLGHINPSQAHLQNDL